MDRSGLPPELAEALEEEFPSGWPPDDETVNSMTTGDVVVVAVESEPVGPHDHTRQELISANQTMRYSHLSPDSHQGLIERLIPGDDPRSPRST